MGRWMDATTGAQMEEKERCKPVETWSMSLFSGSFKKISCSLNVKSNMMLGWDEIYCARVTVSNSELSVLTV